MYTSTVLAFAGAASAAVLMPRADGQCCFNINISGGTASGSLGQYTDGQNRVGPGYGGSKYCYNPNSKTPGSGSLVDGNGRGCVISGPTNQYQCDAGVTASTAAQGISILSNGSIAHDMGNAVWYECYSTAALGVYNIYATNPNALDCQPIIVTTANSTGCAAGSASASSSAPAQSSPVSSAVSSTMMTTTKAPVTSAVSTPATSTVTVTVPVTVPAQTMTVTQPANSVTVTLPASSVTVTQPANSITVTQPANTITVTAMQSCPAPPAPGTVTVMPSCPAPAAPVTVTVMPSCPAPVSSPAMSASMPAMSSPAMSPSKPASVPAMSSPAMSSPAMSSPAMSMGSTSVLTQTVAKTSTVVAPSSMPAMSSPAAPAASACPKGIAGQEYQYPHLIVPVNKDSPNTAYGTQYFGSANSSVSSIFNFDIPASYEGKTCSLEFLLPMKKDLVTSDYTMSGAGAFDFTQLASVATQKTTYANQSKAAKDLGVFSIAPGSQSIIASGPCAAGMAVSYEIMAQGNTALNFFQDYNPAALGLYIVAC